MGLADILNGMMHVPADLVLPAELADRSHPLARSLPARRAAGSATSSADCSVANQAACQLAPAPRPAAA